MLGTLFNQVCVNVSLKCVQSPSLSTQPPQVDSFSLPSLAGSLTGSTAPFCLCPAPPLLWKSSTPKIKASRFYCFIVCRYDMLATCAACPDGRGSQDIVAVSGCCSPRHFSVLCKLVVDFFHVGESYARTPIPTMCESGVKTVCISSVFPFSFLTTSACWYGEFFLSRRSRTYVLAARRLQFLWCVQVKLFGPDTGVSLCRR